MQVRSELNIGSGRNIAVAEYSIDGQSAELVGASGLAKRPGTVDVPEKQVFDTIQTGNIQGQWTQSIKYCRVWQVS